MFAHQIKSNQINKCINNAPKQHVNNTPTNMPTKVQINKQNQQTNDMTTRTTHQQTCQQQVNNTPTNMPTNKQINKQNQQTNDMTTRTTHQQCDGHRDKANMVFFSSLSTLFTYFKSNTRTAKDSCFDDCCDCIV